ncbi:hypothetical protein C0J45_21681 [Silurus meridionalis]|nr:hypothetical protein C0J45_21681 [Silurus meridionalis]
MFWITSTLIVFISAVAYECDAESTLNCPYDSKHKSLQRILCKRHTNNHSCCSGVTFMPEERKPEGLSVEDDGKAFTVSINHLSQGDGVYWCGLRNGTNVIIKLAEKTINSSINFVWSIMRWLIFVLLVLTVISTHVCCRARFDVARSQNLTAIQGVA